MDFLRWNHLRLSHSLFQAIVTATLWMSMFPIAMGDIVITQRSSLVRNRGVAASGGASNQSDVQNSTAALTGSLAFSDSFQVQVQESDPFSNGSAFASGSLLTFDNVLQSSSNELRVLGSRTSQGTAVYGSGSGTATSRQEQDIRVRFSVIGTPVRYSLQGTFDPGDTLGEPGSISLYRPFTAITFFNFDSAQTLNATGVLLPNFTYEFRARVNDSLAANPLASASESDTSRFQFDFSLTPVPEPGVAPLLIGGLGIWGWRRRRLATPIQGAASPHRGLN